MRRATVSVGPLVGIVTPVHNGQQYLSQCIESVLAQSYGHWEYTIVNNCSTDGSLEIAERYAMEDSRIRVVSTDRLLSVMASQNFTFRQVGTTAKYCKMVHADDWIFPDCLRLMVEVAEAHPSIGIVGAYRLDARPDATRVGSGGLPYPSPIVPGRELCHMSLLSRFSLGSASSLLIRADYLQRKPDLFEESEVFGDLAAWYEILQTSDFGFVHQVLTCTRLHGETVTSRLAEVEGDWAADLSILKKYGPLYLSSEEFTERLRTFLRDYYVFLVRSLIARRGPDFWRYHRSALEAMGYSLTWRDLIAAILRRWWYPMAHPSEALSYAGRFLWARVRGASR
jgi:glycosyltransferase involved in cell wall biosynthesis